WDRRCPDTLRCAVRAWSRLLRLIGSVRRGADTVAVLGFVRFDAVRSGTARLGFVWSAATRRGALGFVWREAGRGGSLGFVWSGSAASVVVGFVRHGALGAVRLVADGEPPHRVHVLAFGDVEQAHALGVAP